MIVFSHDVLPAGAQHLASNILEQLLEHDLDVLGTDNQGADMLQIAAAGHNIVALNYLLARLKSGMI